MARKRVRGEAAHDKPDRQSARVEARVEGKCEHCGLVGLVGTQLATYSFGKGDYRLLCWSGTGRECFIKAWEAYRALGAKQN